MTIGAFRQLSKTGYRRSMMNLMIGEFTPLIHHKHVYKEPDIDDWWKRICYRMYTMGVKPSEIMRFRYCSYRWCGLVPLFTGNHVELENAGEFAGGLYRVDALEEIFGVKVRSASTISWPDRFAYRDTLTKYLSIMLTKECIERLEQADRSFEDSVFTIYQYDVIAFVYTTLAHHS